MSRPARVHLNATALLHNVKRVRQCAPHQKIIAMVKANAYGLGMPFVVSVLEGYVDAFGVACIEEGMALRAGGSLSDCILCEGVFDSDELQLASRHNLQCVIHQAEQLQWTLSTPLTSKIKVWVKVNTGMQRLGFFPDEVSDVIRLLKDCPWVDDDIGLMTHLACADEPSNATNELQLQRFNQLLPGEANLTRSIANSAAILALPKTHADAVRPGIMLYGVSPFQNQTGTELGLMPVVCLMSAIMSIHHYPPHSPIGYGSIWQSDKASIIAVVAMGYGDGYPRHIANNTPVFVNGFIAPIVGRVSMDMLTIDISDYPSVKVGDAVEMWGQHIPIETIATSARTIAYELLCQLTSRVKGDG